MSDYLKLGLLGHPLSHSLSPILQTAALQYAGINGEYRLFDIKPEGLADGVREILASGVKGFNITIPYKQNMYQMVDTITDNARQTGAVNTVKVEADGKLVGHNTDVIGFKLSFEEAFDAKHANTTALIIGAGGSAKAVVVALSQMGFKKIKIKGRDPQKVLSFINEMKAKEVSLWEDEQENLSDLDLVVNASPIGLKNEAVPEWLDQLINKLNDQCLCFDLVYGKDDKVPVFTDLALGRGLKAVDGMPMLIHQARYAFEFWTGINVAAEIMRKALNK